MKSAVPRLHLIGPLGEVNPEEYAAISANIASLVASCGIHLRLPGERGGDVLRAARALSQALDQTTATLIINDRLDVAQLAGVPAVHLGERSFSVADARLFVGDGTLIGRSIHDLDGALAAAADGADYLIAGHIYETPSKAGQPGRGIDWLAGICAAVPIPVIAIGGVALERVPPVIAAGAHGVAIGRALLRSNQPGEAAASISAAMHRAGE